MQNIANYYAQRYHIGYNFYYVPKKVKFLETYVLKLNQRQNPLIFQLEPYTNLTQLTNFHNWDDEQKLQNTPHAFAHFTYESSKHKLLVRISRNNKLIGDIYCDPQIYEECKCEFSKSGFDKFLKSHRCNSICKYLKLPEIGPSEGCRGFDAHNTLFDFEKSGYTPLLSEQRFPKIEEEKTKCVCAIL